MNINMRFLPDAPIENQIQDNLGYHDFINLVLSSINNTIPPFVFGIFGEWGSGKTSILKLLYKQLDKDVKGGDLKLVPIWYNAWEYENDSNAIYPLLHMIKKDYESRVDKLIVDSGYFKKDFLKIVTSSTLAIADIGLRVATKLLTGDSVKLSDIKDAISVVEDHPDEIEKIYSNWADEVGNLRKAFDALLSSYAKDLSKDSTQVNTRFAIFIDDLDRCMPETTIAILEGIKNFLTIDSAIFILGLNPRVIYQGIKARYKGIDLNGREYLEKILNYTFYVPDPAPEKIIEFVSQNANNLIIGKDLRSKYSSYFLIIGQVLKDCNFTNPRKIKRILNRFVLFLGLNQSELDHFSIKNTAKLIVLAEYFPDLFKLFLNGDYFSIKEIKEVFSKVGTPDFDITKIKGLLGDEYLTMHPQLIRMNKLLEIEQDSGTEKSILEHSRTIYSITRYI